MWRYLWELFLYVVNQKRLEHLYMNLKHNQRTPECVITWFEMRQQTTKQKRSISCPMRHRDTSKCKFWRLCVLKADTAKPTLTNVYYFIQSFYRNKPDVIIYVHIFFIRLSPTYHTKQSELNVPSHVATLNQSFHYQSQSKILTKV